MAERCNSCGAELFAGQQFCRACGAPTRQFSGEELPTQMLPSTEQQQPQQPAPLSTSPLPGRTTSDPVYGAGYQPYQSPNAPPPPQRPTSPVGAPPPRRRRSRVWLFAALGLLVFFGGAMLVAALFFANQPRQQATRKIVRTVNPPSVPPLPPHPMDAGDEEMLLDDEGAEISGGQTVITKTYPLAKDGSFELHNISGDITIEGWDEPQAEVKIIKRGGSEEERAGLKIMREESANRLMFSTMPEAHSGGVREVQYQVKLPRNLRELEIVSNNSNIELIKVNTASISINVQRGNIELEDVSGTVNSRTTKGNTKVLLSEAALQKSAPQVFNGIHGNIELKLAPGINAELKAETIDGQIEIDEDFGIKVEKRMIGQQAVGRLGTGGQPIVVKVISGNIKIQR